MNANRLKQYTFGELVGLQECFLMRVNDLECKIATAHLLRSEKQTNIKNMWSQIKDYKEDILDIKQQIEKIVSNENK